MNHILGASVLVLVMVTLMSSSVSSQLCLSETNNARASNGRPALQYNGQLAAAAKAHNDRMISTNCFSHQCSGEGRMGDRVTPTGYRWGGVAENIAAGSSNCGGTMNQWMNSPGHKQNILGQFQHVGCAMGTCANCAYPTYWTCVYAKPM